MFPAAPVMETVMGSFMSGRCLWTGGKMNTSTPGSTAEQVLRKSSEYSASWRSTEARLTHVFQRGGAVQAAQNTLTRRVGQRLCSEKDEQAGPDGEAVLVTWWSSLD